MKFYLDSEWNETQRHPRLVAAKICLSAPRGQSRGKAPGSIPGVSRYSWKRLSIRNSGEILLVSVGQTWGDSGLRAKCG